MDDAPGGHTVARKCVMLVGRNTEGLRAREALLDASGFECVRVETIEAALSFVADQMPDAVIIAGSLPGQKQAELVRLVRAAVQGAGVSVACIIAARATEEAIEELLLFGADELIGANAGDIEFTTRTRALLRMRHLREEISIVESRHETEIADLKRRALFDGLTGTANRSHLERRLAEEVERSRRYGQPLTMIAIDLDHFKQVNDTHGHAIGDGVLRGVSVVLGRGMRQVDLLARVGGEEFIVLAPATPLDGARVLAERLRASLQAAPILATAGSGMHVMLLITASFGVACLDPRVAPASLTASVLMETADAALYRAKQAGRNRVEFAAP